MPDSSPPGDDAAPREDAARGPKRAGRIGRRIALALWAVGMSYMVVVGFVSVISQVFFPAPANGSAREAAVLADATCGDAIETLTSELLERGGEHVAEARPAATLSPFFRRWDGRFRALQARCGDGDAMAEVGRLRYRLELTLRRFDREEGAIVRRLDRP